MGPCADAAMCTVRSRTGGIVLGGGTPWTTIACGPDCALGRVGEIRGHDDGRRPVDEFAGMVGFDAAQTALLLLRPAGTFDFASATTLTLCALARMADKGHTATSIRCRGGSTSLGGGMRWPWKGEAEEEEAELGSICCPPRARWKCGAGTTIKDDVVRIQRANGRLQQSSHSGILGRGRAGSRDQGHSLTLFGPTRLILVAQDRRLPARLAARVEGGFS
jgi:hypothetical protein